MNALRAARCSLVCLLAVSLGICSSLAAQPNMEVFVPAYFYPSAGSDWERMNTAALTVDLTAILNPNSGPGSGQDTNYVSAVDSLRAVGGRVIGYVYSGYGGRPLNDVLTDIDRYANWYDIDGIFVDEMSNSGSTSILNYYEQVYTHAKNVNAAWEVVGNPGTNTLETYISTPVVDRIVTFEQTGSAYPGYTPAAWTANYDADKFIHLVHSEPSTTNMENFVELAVQRNAGAIYLTDDVLNNPWDRLPTYWDEELTAIQQAGTGGGRSPLEVQGNPVTAGTIDVSPGNNDRTDWNDLPAYQADVDSGTAPGPELDFSQVQLAHDGANVYLRMLLNESPSGTPQFFGFRHNMFLDVDQDRGSGFVGTGGSLSVGADYLLQGSTLYEFSGSQQTDFSWTPIQSVPYDDFPTTDIETLIPRAELGNADSFDFVIYGANSDFSREDYYPSGAIHGVNGDFFRYRVGTTGDFDGDGFFSCTEIDALVAEIAAVQNGAAPDANFDLNGDGDVNNDDLDAWLVEAGAAPTSNTSGAAYLYGDANLDGTVDGQDFLAWNMNKFTSLAAWCGGDFNADGTIDGQDFLLWNSNKFTTADTNQVPEPGGPLWLSALLLLAATGFRPWTN